MNQGRAALSRFRLGATRETLEEARLLAQATKWQGALNRVYYAMFYAAQAFWQPSNWPRHVTQASLHSSIVSLSALSCLQNHTPGISLSHSTSETEVIIRIFSLQTPNASRNSSRQPSFFLSNQNGLSGSF
jgi:hypothetical protein